MGVELKVWHTKLSGRSSGYAQVDAENRFDEAIIETYRAFFYLVTAVAEVGLIAALAALRWRNSRSFMRRLIKWSFIPAVAAQYYVWYKTSPDVADIRPRVHASRQHEWD